MSRDFGGPSPEEMGINEKRKYEIDRSLINNQMKLNLGEEMSDYFKAQGYQITHGGYTRSDNKDIIDEPNFGDNSLSFRISYENIAGSEINTETNSIDDVAYFEEESGRSLKQIFDEIIEEGHLWEEDADNRVITHRIRPTTFVIAKRVPKYSKDATQDSKQFEIFVSIVNNNDKTYVDERTLEQIREDEIAALTEVFQTPIDYEELQRNYKSSIEENKEVFKKYYDQN